MFLSKLRQSSVWRAHPHQNLPPSSPPTSHSAPCLVASIRRCFKFCHLWHIKDKLRCFSGEPMQDNANQQTDEKSDGGNCWLYHEWFRLSPWVVDKLSWPGRWQQISLLCFSHLSFLTCHETEKCKCKTCFWDRFNDCHDCAPTSNWYPKKPLCVKPVDSQDMRLMSTFSSVFTSASPSSSEWHHQTTVM